MIPSKIVRKAEAVFAEFMAGKLHPRKGTHCPYLALNVGYRHRLFCRDLSRRYSRSAWQLVTHEAYNNLSRRPFQ